MKLSVLLGLLILVALVRSERCIDKDPLECHNLCPIDQVHSCQNERCYCKPGKRCLLGDDCNALVCNRGNHQNGHCIDGECHCLAFDKVDNNED